MKKTTINAYFNFNDKCREAMTFYKECFGGELTLQTVGESPMAAQMPPHLKDAILHSSLTSGDITIMGSDMNRNALVEGNTVQLCITCKSEEDLNSLFANLSAGGKVTSPIADMPWGAKFGSLTDKYGENWMFNFDKNSQ
jgi:PhnB protein